MAQKYNIGDIVFTRGHSFISRAIRFFSKTGGESRTKVNHVGIIVNITSYGEPIIVEALNNVKRHTLQRAYGNKPDDVAVYSPTNLTDDEIASIVQKAESFVGKKYGYAKIVTHMLDWFLGGRYFFRRMTNTAKYPICSWVVASAYGAAGKDFGVPVGQAQPDDIWDFCVKNADKYVCVRNLLTYP